MSPACHDVRCPMSNVRFPEGKVQNKGFQDPGCMIQIEIEDGGMRRWAMELMGFDVR